MHVQRYWIPEGLSHNKANMEVVLMLIMETQMAIVQDERIDGSRRCAISELDGRRVNVMLVGPRALPFHIQA